MNSNERNKVFMIVLVSALGYFVDIYDLILFSIIRITSLKSLGITSENSILSNGVLLLNMQMFGMLVGGILWGILGDKKGRLKVLFGSILLYSVANIVNGFVESIPQYAVLRFIAGVGLAGELGAGITLVSEVMTKEQRGYGTMIVASIGIFGAVAAALIGDLFEWRIAFFVGGGMGLALLILRITVYESGMYDAIKNAAVRKGNFLKLFSDKKLFFKYLYSIAIGVPIWFVVGVLITFSPEFSKYFHIEGITAGNAVMFTYIGLAIGDLASGALSQIIKSRKKIIKIFILINIVIIFVYLYLNLFGVFYFYTLCLILGFVNGYWAVFVTNASEQFGTNMRATVTTTVPNFVRGAVVPATFLFQFLSTGANLGVVYSASIVGFLTIIFALFSVHKLEETYGKDLNYLEII
jgi:MFS family permease